MEALMTMEKKKRRLWQKPWQYRESALLVAGIVLAGFMLQLGLGPFDFFLLHSPVNVGIAVFLLLMFGSSIFIRKTALFRWFSGIPLCVALITALLFFGLIMGLTPQVSRPAPHGHNIFSDLGFTAVTSSWPFVLLYATTILSLGLVIVRRLCFFRKGDFAFYCNHIGLLVLLVSAGLGASDMRRFVMHVPEGETEWRVYNPEGEMLELPIAIRLNDFFMEEYPPKLVIIHRETGKAQPEGKPLYFQIDEKNPSGKLGEWEIILEEYLHEAVRSGDGYLASPMPASTPAARVRIQNMRTGEAKTGWICGGGAIPAFFSGITLTEDLIMVMTRPEPKRFVSDILVWTREGRKVEAKLEVNRPLTVAPWMLYQYGYDHEAGKMSTYTSIELVMDSWLSPAYLGIVLMMIGSLLLIFRGTGKKERENGLE